MSLTPLGDLSAAAWITASELPWQQLVTFGPQEFPTYARLRFLPDPTSPGQEEPELGADDPDEFDLLRIALDVLGEQDPPPPAFIWPADHAWCLAFDVDSHYAGIGATPDAIAQLVAHPALDAVPAEPDEQHPYYM